MEFSIIIVSFNTCEALRECLDAAGAAVAGRGEIIVIDNASTDGTRAMLAGRPEKVILNQENAGFARACNQGAAAAQGEILFFINSDALLTAEVLEAVTEAFRAHPQAAIASPLLYDASGRSEKQARGNFPTLAATLFGRVAMPDSSGESEPREVDWVSGAALAIRHDAFLRLSGFDEAFFMYFEDVDLCYRAHRLGYSVLSVPEPRMLHRRGLSLSDDRTRKKYYYESQLYFFRKNFGYLAAAALRCLRVFSFLR